MASQCLYIHPSSLFLQVSIPITTMGDCWRKVLEVAHEGDLDGTNATQRYVLPQPEALDSWAVCA